VNVSQILSHSLLGRASGEAAVPGAAISARPDRIVRSGARCPGVVSTLRETTPPSDPDRLILSLDFHAPDVESHVPHARALCHAFAREHGLRHVFDLNAGIGSTVILEWGLVLPGHLVVGSGQCLGVVGGIGALGLRLEPDALVRVVTEGTANLEMPEALEIRVQGRLARYLGPWDVARAMAEALGERLSNRVLEITGETEAWSVGFRIALCGLLSEMGVAAALVQPDATIGEWLEAQGLESETTLPDSGSGEFAHSLELDLESVAPVLGSGYAGETRPLADSLGEVIHGAFVGSCYGGHFDDLSTAAEILRKAGDVDPGVRLVLSPATLEVARACLNAGYYDIFLRAGAMVTVPGAGAGSIGGGAVLGAGETMVSTSEYHHTLPPGQEGPRTAVLSPAAATAAAVAGKIVDPAEFIA